MSYSSNYNLNQRVSYLEYEIGKIAPIPPTGYVTLDGTQVLGAGVKTFTDLPQCNQVPTIGAQLVNKTYVDALFPPVADTLANVLLAGNNAGASDIDLNNQQLLNCAEITASADLILNPTGSIDCNGKTINLTGGEIHNCPLIHSQNNTNITIEGKGTGDVILKTGNTDRLTISDTGFQTFQGGMTYNNATNTLTTGTENLSGNLNFTGSGQRITADFSNATITNRTHFQTSTTNGHTRVGAIPNGTSNIATFLVSSNSDPTNTSSFNLTTDGTTNFLNSSTNGTGTLLPIEIRMNSNPAMSVNTSSVCSFSSLPTCSVVPSSGDQLVNKTYVDSKVGNLYFFDDCFGEGASVNGLLCCRLAGSGSGNSAMANAEASHYGIVRVNNPASNTNSTWTTNSPFIWSNINYVEIVFRGWPTGTSTNTTLSVGLMNSTSSLETTAICVMYSTNVAPTGVWQLRVGSANAYSFNAVNFPQLVNTWMKIRLTNTNDTGSWSATLTRLDTNVSETATGTGVITGTQFYIGGGVSCVSGGVSKYVDFDSIELQLK